MEWMTTVNAPGSVYLMQGNEAVVRGALEAGIDFAASYPGSPSSQVLSMLGNAADRFNFYAEWSTNEVVAFEACLGASFAGARALCIVKQNGLLVLGDALCCGALSGIRGGLVLITSDDPDSHSSTNEFDSRHMADMADVPMLEPTCMQEAKDLLPYAFELSEQLKQIVMIRLTTRVCHGRGNVVLGKLPEGEKRKFRVDEWDRMLCMNLLHGQMLDKLDKVQGVFESCEFNHYEGPENPEALVIAGGTGRMYTLEALEDLGLKDRIGLLSLATIWPLPEKLITSYLKKISRILVVEEVDPVLQRGIYAIAGKNGLAVDILGRDGGKLLPRTQELNPDVVRKALMQFMNIEADTGELQTREDKGLEIPDRELSFCAGCPHRATFFLLKQAVRRQKSQVAVVGDIGCYSLDMVLNTIGYPKPLTVSGYTSDFFGKDPVNFPGHPEYAEKFSVDDFAAAFIRLEGGVILDFRISWAMNMDTPGDTIILGTKAGLRVPSTECWNGSIGGPLKLYRTIAGSDVETEIPERRNDEDNFYNKIRYFIDAVKTGGKAPVPSSQILYNQAIIDGIARSAKLGREVEIEIPEI